MSAQTTYHFVFDRRKNFQTYEASFLDPGDADRFIHEKGLGEFAYVTTDLRGTLVRPKVLAPNWHGVGALGYRSRR